MWWLSRVFKKTKKKCGDTEKERNWFKSQHFQLIFDPGFSLSFSSIPPILQIQNEERSKKKDDSKMTCFRVYFLGGLSYEYHHQMIHFFWGEILQYFFLKKWSRIFGLWNEFISFSANLQFSSRKFFFLAYKSTSSQSVKVGKKVHNQLGW